MCLNDLYDQLHNDSCASVLRRQRNCVDAGGDNDSHNDNMHGKRYCNHCLGDQALNACASSYEIREDWGQQQSLVSQGTLDMSSSETSNLTIFPVMHQQCTILDVHASSKLAVDFDATLGWTRPPCGTFLDCTRANVIASPRSIQSEPSAYSMSERLVHIGPGKMTFVGLCFFSRTPQVRS